MQLRQALTQYGYKVVDLFRRLELKHNVNYQQIAMYCRCNNRSRHDPVVWKWIMDELKEMGVTWIER